MAFLAVSFVAPVDTALVSTYPFGAGQSLSCYPFDLGGFSIDPVMTARPVLSIPVHRPKLFAMAYAQIFIGPKTRPRVCGRDNYCNLVMTTF